MAFYIYIRIITPLSKSSNGRLLIKNFILDEKETQVNFDKDYVSFRLSIRLDDDNDEIYTYFITNNVDGVIEKIVTNSGRVVDKNNYYNKYSI